MYARWASRLMKDMDEIPGWIGVIRIPLVTSTSWVLMTSTSTATFYMLLYWTSFGLYSFSLEEHFLVALFAAWLYFAAYTKGPGIVPSTVMALGLLNVALLSAILLTFIIIHLFQLYLRMT
ncbi:unnamed protein product [Polarella glacialis]|uniref:Uncharacterized protein n=1 Tax=Polarella glacialis TaxID=89957 RepID=A0A813E539_POLGL|nr:unnamed protein product [Polarella glacialis]CAE8623804.1 unnamed protein product [Polarella glacialis]CAE8740136.1 unnamed protein product [Polarella glacialis]